MLDVRGSGLAKVKAIKSGLLPVEKIEQLFADARTVVYPSFREGFGMPIVKALGYGRNVVARRSALLSEVAAHCGARGRILPFDTPASSIDAVRGSLSGAPHETVPLGGAIGEGFGRRAGGGRADP